MTDEIYTPPGGPPQGSLPNPKIFQAMGQDNIFKMCRDFYSEIEKTDLRELFPKDLEKASEKIAAFLVGICGGPPLYHKMYGPPRMRARHLPFAINEQAREIWLSCFKKVLSRAEKDYQFPSEHKNNFITFLENFSAWMVNRQ